MRNRIAYLLLIIFFSFVFLVFYRGLDNSNLYTPKTDVKDIPEFTSKTFFEKKSLNSRDIFNKNNFYLLNIWASWCAPCRIEHPFLMNLSNQKNLEIIGLNYKDKKENAKKFLKELNNPYEIIIQDKDGTIAIEWGAYGVPESFLIYNNKIVKKIIGPINKDSFLKIQERIK